MDVIDLDFIGDPENLYRYWISNDFITRNMRLDVRHWRLLKIS